MADPEEVARIRAYLQQHRERYHRSALHAKLIGDGHDSRAIEEALSQVYGVPTPPASPEETWLKVEAGIAVTWYALRCLGTLLVALLVIGVVVLFLRGMCPIWPRM